MGAEGPSIRSPLLCTAPAAVGTRGGCPMVGAGCRDVPEHPVQHWSPWSLCWAPTMAPWSPQEGHTQHAGAGSGHCRVRCAVGGVEVTLKAPAELGRSQRVLLREETGVSGLFECFLLEKMSFFRAFVRAKPSACPSWSSSR